MRLFFKLQKLRYRSSVQSGRLCAATPSELQKSQILQSQQRLVCGAVHSSFDTPGALTQSSPPCAGSAALGAETELHRFWCQLAAVWQLSKDAYFPLEGDDVQGRLLVRQCYVDFSQILQVYMAAGGHTFIITGTPGNSLRYCIQDNIASYGIHMALYYIKEASAYEWQ